MKPTMTNFIQWLHHRKPINFCLVVLFFLLVVLPHEQVGLLVVHIFKKLAIDLNQVEGRNTYNFIILLIGLVGLGSYFVPVLKNIYTHSQDRAVKLFYLITTLIFVVLAFNSLLVVNIEIIHFLQYGLMAILLFPLTQRYGETLFWVTLLGAIDEAYQYFYLAPHRTDYYDFNDVIINLLGGALGLILLRTMDLGEVGINRKKWIKAVPAIVVVVISIVIFTLYKIGILYVYPPEEELTGIILLVKKIPISFWSVIHPNVTYHVVQPLEGLILLGILLLFYAGLGKKTLTVT